MERVLIMDDDDLLFHAITRVLQAYSPEVKAVSTADEALTEISSRFYHLCFVDIALPRLHGIQTLKRIKDASPDTNLVVMTGILIDDEMRQRIEEHAFRILAKPFEISELKEVARQALAKPEEESYAVARRAKRILHRCTVDYCVNVVELGRPITLNLKGDLIDITDIGVALRTYYPLEPGHLLLFTSGLAPLEQKAGIVRWSAVTDGSYTYRVGIEFLESGQPPWDTAGELGVQP